MKNKLNNLECKSPYGHGATIYKNHKQENICVSCGKPYLTTNPPETGLDWWEQFEDKFDDYDFTTTQAIEFFQDILSQKTEEVKTQSEEMGRNQVLSKISNILSAKQLDKKWNAEERIKMIENFLRSPVFDETKLAKK